MLQKLGILTEADCRAMREGATTTTGAAAAAGGKSPPNLTLPQQIASSSCGAMITAIWITPMDVVKIRLQRQGKPPGAGQCFYYNNGLMEHRCEPCVQRQPCEWYERPGNFKGPIDAVTKITRSEGVRSLWSGLSPTLLTAVPATALYFTMYDRLRDSLQRRIRDQAAQNASHLPLWTAPLFAGVLARSLTVCASSPVEMIRTKMQSEHLPLTKLFTVVRSSYESVGWRSLYLGLGPTLLRDVPFSAVYWGSVETTKAWLMQRQGRKETTFAISFAAAASSAAVATILTAPMDLIKTRRQISFGMDEAAMRISTFRYYRDILHKEGFQAFFVGTTPRLMKVVPACAIMLACYDYAKIFFAHHNQQQQQ